MDDSSPIVVAAGVGLFLAGATVADFLGFLREAEMEDLLCLHWGCGDHLDPLIPFFLCLTV